MTERLQKFIARSSEYSRRKAEMLIQDGKVQVNGQQVTELGTSIDPAKDQVQIGEQIISAPQELRYIALNKPIGYVCTRAQHPGERTVYDLVSNSRDLVIAGRLDKESEGLVLLTNDGALVQQLTHPSFAHEKEYLVTTQKSIQERDIAQLKKGLLLSEGLAKVDTIHRVNPFAVRLTLHQGWKRQIRRMFAMLKCDIRQLQRVRMSQLELGDLALGKWRQVEKSEIVK